MTFTVKHKIHYVPLPPEKEHAYNVALLGLWEMLVEAMDEIDKNDVKGKKKRKLKKNDRHNEA